MHAIPLQLDGYFIEELQYRINPDVEGRSDTSHEDPMMVKADFSQHAENPHRYRVALRIDIPRESNVRTPYELALSLVGFFEVPDTLKAEDAEAYVTNGAPSILYGAAREIILALTSRGPFDPVLLPATAFRDSQQAIDPLQELPQPVAPPDKPAKRSPRKKAPAKGHEG